jgi:competence ComEA-like helix-hairpin-helix protein
MTRTFRFRKLRLPKLRRPDFSLPKIMHPVLTGAEKTALAAVVLVLCAGAALRAWERSGVQIGPVEDWETLRDMVIRAHTDFAAEGGDGRYDCAEDAPPGHFGSGEGAGAERNILAAGAASVTHREKSVSGGGGKRAPSRPVDLNTASEKTLLSLPGVGPSTAKAILAHRAAKGGFGSVEELLGVKGIGPKKLAAIRPFVQVTAQGTDAQKPHAPQAPVESRRHEALGPNNPAISP